MIQSRKIVVISDTHGDIKTMNKVVQKELPFDHLIHCGDSECNPKAVLEHQDQYELLAVKGNCDWSASFPATVKKKIGFYNIFVVHGHEHDVENGTEILSKSAKKNFADVVCYGHTHIPEIGKDESTGILLINPGSLTENRPSSRKGTYAVLTISEDELPSAILKELGED